MGPRPACLPRRPYHTSSRLTGRDTALTPSCSEVISLELHTLASGSSGNALLFSAGGAHLLVDAGISCKRITEGLHTLGLSPADLSGILITHEHSDHIAGLATLLKRHPLPLYTSPGTAGQLCRRMAFIDELIYEMEPGEDYEVGPFGVSPFATSHDAAQSMGFSLDHEGRRAAVVTDLGYVSDEVLDGVLGAQLVVCESNHDVDWLLSGSYPYPLRARILGDRGHLSNEAGADLARQCAEHGARTLVLAHLSAENNTPARALAVAQTALESAGITVGIDVDLSVAPRNQLSHRYEV